MGISPKRVSSWIKYFLALSLLTFLVRSLFWVFLAQTTVSTAYSVNPFAVNFPVKIELTHDDYVKLQSKLRKMDLNPLLSSYHRDLQRQGHLHYSYRQLYTRCANFLYQDFINQSRGLLPRKQLIKINNGGSNCVVCYVTYTKQYPDLQESQIVQLEKTGFNGYYLSLVGGYPNPTGKEVAYAGVPYVFKIFGMIEAHKLGFDNVLWLDAALFPKRDITPIFDEIEKTGFTAHHKAVDMEEIHQLPPKTRALLQELTSIDVLDSQKGRRIFGGLIGLKMSDPLTKLFIKQYYEFVEMGTPFISGLPEEFVFSAILGQPQYAEWMRSSYTFENNFPARFFSSPPGDILGCGYFFDWRKHAWADPVNCKQVK